MKSAKYRHYFGVESLLTSSLFGEHVEPSFLRTFTGKAKEERMSFELLKSIKSLNRIEF